MTITERIFSELTQRKLSQKDFSIKINVNEKTVSAWKKNNSLPPADKISDISDFLGVSLEYLLTGTEKCTASDFSLSDIQQEALSAFDRLSFKDQIMFIGKMEQRYEDYSPEEKESVS